MAYENVYREDNHQENLDAISMYKMRDAADVVIEEDANGVYNITKPEGGYNGQVLVDSPFLFAQTNPQASVLFLRYAGGFTRWNYTGETIPVAKSLVKMGAGSTVKVDSMFYTKESNTYEINVSGAGAVPGTVDAETFGTVKKYAQLTFPDFLPVGNSVVTQINPALAEYDGVDEYISVTADGWTKKKSYTVSSKPEQFDILIPGVPTDIKLILVHGGVTTTYVIHCDVAYANTDVSKANAATLGNLGMKDAVLTP